MKSILFRLSCAALLTVAGCGHRQKALPDESSLLALQLSPCLRYAMSASEIPTPGASKEEVEKIRFADYSSAFLDVKEQKKYIACLDGNPRDEDYRADRRRAERELGPRQADVDKYKAFFPPEKQIVDVVQTFTDVSDKLGNDHVVVTLRDGTQTASDSRFEKTPP